MSTSNGRPLQGAFLAGGGKMGKDKGSRTNSSLFISTVGPRPLRPGEDRFYHWSELALCIGKSEMFTVTTFELARKMSLDIKGTVDLYKHNVANFQKAEALCKACPVLSQCTGAVVDDDAETDMLRAGVWPKAVDRPSETPKKIPSVSRGVLCAKGHDDWKVKKLDGKYFCAECARVGARKRYHDRKAGRAADPRWTRGICAYGHDKAVVGSDAKGECMECRRIRGRRYRAAKMKA